jgi:calcineurin-like phosphoesterase family protein
MSIYTCSDLHGNFDLYKQIKKSLKPEDKVYFLGDAGDRGKDPWKLIKYIYTDPQFIYLKGNHEDMLVKAVRSYLRYENISDINISLLFSNGGYDTFMDCIEEDYIEKWMDCIDKLPLYQDLFNDDGIHIHLSHAGFTTNKNEIIHEDRLLWDRTHFNDGWDEESCPNDIIIHGHTTIQRLQKELNIPKERRKDEGAVYYANNHKIDIDNATYRTGVVTLLDLNTFTEKLFRM